MIKFLFLAIIALVYSSGCERRALERQSMPHKAKTPTEESTKIAKPLCQNLLSGIITPLKDLQTFTDTAYIEVTATSRQAWDKQRLPLAVLEWEEKGYSCTPYPEKLIYPQQRGDILAQPQVKEVRWECQKKYQSYQYLPAHQEQKKTVLARQGYNCEKMNCLAKDGTESSVWFCFQ
jgi:hypothetical protein